jgi:hypothetical protein
MYVHRFLLQLLPKSMPENEVRAISKSEDVSNGAARTQRNRASSATLRTEAIRPQPEATK